MNDQIEDARQTYLALCTSIGTSPVLTENVVLSIGREFLLPCARAVLDGEAASADYYHWLAHEVAAVAEEAGAL